MPRMVINHHVTDVENWLKFKAQRAADLSPFGSDITDHVATDGSNSVAVTLDVHDLAGLEAVMASPDPTRAASMEAQGIVGPLVVHLEA